MNNIFSKKTKDAKVEYDTMSSLSHTKWNCKCKFVNDVKQNYIKIFVVH